MENQSCKKCKKRSFHYNDDTGLQVCSSCGTVNSSFTNYDAQIGGINGPEGTFIRIGSAGTGSFYSYKEKKVLEAKSQIEDLTTRLGISASKSDDIMAMISKITDGEFGLGDWFALMIGACSYVVMRSGNRSLPMAEIAAAIGCDVHELGRMINRVVDFLDLDLPEFDIVSSFERSLKNCSIFKEVAKDLMVDIRKQGVFLVQCAVKWFLTTGRRPLPVVAAVLMFVGELNRIDVKLVDIAKEVNAPIQATKMRYRELLVALVKVAQVLPWGKDVTVNNVVRNAPFVLQYMEMKSMENTGRDKMKDSESLRTDMEAVTNACLLKETHYGTYGTLENDSGYFESQNRNNFHETNLVETSEKFKDLNEGLSMAYSKLKENISLMKEKGESGQEYGGTRNIGYEFRGCIDDLWVGNSTLCQKLVLNQILEKDVGLDPMPPSFVAGCKANERRRDKIKASKMRINKIMNVQSTDLDTRNKPCFSETGKKRKKRNRPVGDIEWEDFVIETLLLHQVKEEEIEKGHYKALMDLHVFNSGVM